MKKVYAITLLFWIFCLAVFFLTDGIQVVRYGPRSVHVWRQADCCSYTLNYYQNHQPFFMPQTHTLLGKDGHVVSEFPILYFTAAKIYSLLGGKHHYVLRTLNFFIFTLGCTCLLWMCHGLFENKWLAFVPAIFVFTSPYLFYYALNFLPDVPAFSFALIGLYFLFLYFKKKKVFLLWFFAASFCLAGLLKISADISLMACLLAVILFRELRSEKFFVPKHLFHFFGSILLALGIQVGWIFFAKHFNEQYGNGQNLLGLYPIWEATAKDFSDTFLRMRKEWLWVILHPLVWLWFIASGIFFVRKFSSIHRFVKHLVWLNFLGTIVYSLLWFKAYYAHDYYMINPFMALLWIIIAICLAVEKSSPVVKKVFIGISLLAGLFAVKQVRHVQHARYHDSEFIFVNEAYFDIESYVRWIGISRTEKVVSVPDISPNITLYYLNQPGWTEAFTNENFNINYFAANGAKYLFVGDDKYLSDPIYTQHMDSLIGTYWNVRVYRMK